MGKILKCKKCGDIIQSKHRHDMVWCKCHSIAIDGGDDYFRWAGNKDDIEVYVPESELVLANHELSDCYDCIKSLEKEIREYYIKVYNKDPELAKQLLFVGSVSDFEIMKKSKIALAIEKLEEIKHYLIANIIWYGYKIETSPTDFIDNKIQELKEMMKSE